MYKFFLTISLLFLLGCESYNNVDHVPSVEGDITDNDSLYSGENDVLGMSVSIPVPNTSLCRPHDDLTAPLRPCTLEDIDNDTDANDDYEPILNVRMSTDDFIPSSEQTNAEFEQKGKSTRNAAQKSYRVKLNEGTLYNGEETFQLNKHPNDDSRVRNKLAFEFFSEIPNFTSLKTQFMDLKIDGTDYGLFTHVEKVGKEFLLNRGWNKDDNLYKAQNFAFRMVSALSLDSSGKPLYPDAFDAVIEIERGKDHSKLIAMLNAVDKARTDSEFEKVFSQYFNRNNYVTWMAINIIMANKDTVSQNFYLYNPLYSNTFYLLPWDYDGSGRATEKYAKWELGISTWWGIPLHKKFLTIQKNRNDLDAMVTKLRTDYITPEKIQEKLDIYDPLIRPLLSTNPDADELSVTRWETEFNVLIPRLDENINNYTSQFGHPMPFWQGHGYKDGNLTLMWDEAVDFEGDEIVYDLYCADNVDFNNSIIYEQNMTLEGGKLAVTSWGEVSYQKPISLTSGDRYYMKVIAKEKNDNSHYQIAFDKEVEINDVKYFGLLEFKID